MPTAGRTFFVRQPAQLRTLASGARQEILDALARLGTVSVAQIARTLDRPAAGLYYHLQVLVRSGLVIAVRKAGRSRSEALYRAVAPEVRLPPSMSKTKPVATIVSSLLRLGARDYRRAAQRPDAKLPKGVRELWALRTVGRLTDEQLSRVNRSIRDMLGEMERSPKQGKLYAVTVLLTPLDRRRSSDAEVEP